jgi:hypothetical protein
MNHEQVGRPGPEEHHRTRAGVAREILAAARDVFGKKSSLYG